MSDREVPFEDNVPCDSCGARGAFDFMGDLLCGACADLPVARPPKPTDDDKAKARRERLIEAMKQGEVNARKKARRQITGRARGGR